MEDITLDIGIASNPAVPESGKYIGIDLYVDALKGAREEMQNKAGALLLVAHATALPFPDKSITTVQAYNVLSDAAGVDIDYDNCIDEKDVWEAALHGRNIRLLNEVARVLKPGGTLKLKQTMGLTDDWDGISNALKHLHADNRFLLTKAFGLNFEDLTVSKQEFIRTEQE